MKWALGASSRPPVHHGSITRAALLAPPGRRRGARLAARRAARRARSRETPGRLTLIHGFAPDEPIELEADSLVLTTQRLSDDSLYRQLKSDRAALEAEGIEASDGEVDEALRAAAPPDASEKQLKRALKRARSQGADEALREDIAMRKAVDLLVEHAKPIPADQAAAREKLWTPEKEDAGAASGSGEIWTPGS